MTVGAAELDRPREVIDRLHRAWASREPLVVELAVDAAELRRPLSSAQPPYRLDPTFEFPLERLHFLVWANNYDARGGEPVWWHGRKAARLAGPAVTEGGPADLVLGDGTAAWIDGGPAHPPATGDGAAVVHRWNAETGDLRPAGTRAPSAELASDQLAAVAHPSGPVRVVAPAGSGKTRVLTERLRHLLADRGVPPGTVTALAYNTKAAAELRQRCGGLVTEEGPAIRTLNSFGLWICNELGGAGRWAVAEEAQVRSLLEELFTVRRRANTDVLAPYIDALSAVRLGLVPPGEVEELIPDATGIAEGFDRYRRALHERGWVDFDEQIYRAIEILLGDPAARAAVQARCRYLLVDEFQDLTPAHLLLIRLVAAPGYDCFGVGDDDQVLYGYAGATPEYLVHYGRYFPGAAERALEVNYRCPPAVVEAASQLLSYNADRVPKVIRAARPPDDPGPEGGAVVVHRLPGAGQAQMAASLIGQWAAAGVPYGEMAVLARVNSALLPVQVALAEAGMPSTSALTAHVLQRTGVRTALAYLRIGLDPGRIARSDVVDTVRRPSRGIAPMVVDMLTRSSTTSVNDVRRLAGRLSGRDVAKLEAYADDLERVVAACRLPTAEALAAVRTGIGLDETMDVLDGSRREADRSTHADDLMALESLAGLHPDVATFEPWLRALLSRPSAPPGDGTDGGEPGVLLSTVHRIKGREWDRVIVYGVTAGLVPHRLSDDDEAERRVLHVALTRARHQVVLLADDQLPSPFLGELDGARPRQPLRREVRRSGAVDPGPRRRRPAEGADRPPAGPEEEARRQALRVWRSSVAARDKVPAFVVLSDRDLDGIAAAAPAGLVALSRCRGIGPQKLERWGDEILAVLEAAGGG